MIGYATAQTLTKPGSLTRWSQLTSYTTPPPPVWTWNYTADPSGYITVTGTQPLWTFEKTTSAGWNACVKSQAGLSAGTCIWTNPMTGAGSIKGGWMPGISNNPGGTVNYPTVTYGISLYSGLDTMEIYNGGSPGGLISGGYTNTTEFKWVWTSTGGSGNGTVTLYVNNVLKGGPWNRANSNPLYVYGCFNVIGSTGKVTYYG